MFSNIIRSACSRWENVVCVLNQQIIPKAKEKIYIVVIRFPDLPYYFVPTLKFLKTCEKLFVKNCNFWDYDSTFQLKRIVKMKELARHLSYSFLAMKPEHKYLFSWPK